MSLKSLVFAIGVGVSGLMLSGCVSEGYYGSGGGYYDPYYVRGGYVGSGIIYDSGRDYRRYPRYSRDGRYRGYRNHYRHRDHDRPGRPNYRPDRPRPPERPPSNAGDNRPPSGNHSVLRTIKRGPR